MMYMINANFTKQEAQAPQANDALEKDGKSDDFNALMSGLCMTPPDRSTPVPVSEKPTEQSDEASRMAGDRANLGSVKCTDPKNPSFTPLPEPVELSPNTPPLPAASAAELPTAGVSTPLGQQLKRIGDIKFLPPSGEIKIKDLKTQANKFEEVPAAPDTVGSPIQVAKNFAVMTQDKTALITSGVKSLAGLSAQVKLSDTGVLNGDVMADVMADQGNTHLDHNFVADQLGDQLGDQPGDQLGDQRGCLLADTSVKPVDFVRSQRKLPKLISDVAGIAADETSSILYSEIAQTEVSVPKASTAAAMLEQIRPAVIQLAAAAANEGRQILKMRLHPAELGTVEIRLEKNDAGVLEAHFKTDTDTARHFLTQGLDALRHSLQNAGWQVGRVEISTGAFSPNSSGADGGDSWRQKDAGQRNETSTGSKDFGPASTRSDDQADILTERLVNLRA
jgi:hypothetical protein